MHHTLMWSNTTVSNTAEVDLTPVTDPVVPVTAANHFLPQHDAPIVYMGAASANLQRARWTTPTIALITTPFVRPINQALTWGFPQRTQDMVSAPMNIKGLEEITVFVTQNGGATQQVVVTAGIMWQNVPAPPGNCWTLRATSVTAAGVNIWTQLALTFQNALPTGIYAVTGLQHESATGLAARCIIENQVPRPGTMSMQSLTNDTHWIFRGFGPEDLGNWGQFHNYNMPLVEVFCTAADALHEVYLDIVKVG